LHLPPFPKSGKGWGSLFRVRTENQSNKGETAPRYDSYEGQIGQSVSNKDMRFIKGLSIALVMVVFLISILVVAVRYELGRNADRIIRASYELFQQEQRPSLESVRERFGDKLKQTSPCKDVGCGFEVVLSNRLLARFHLAQFATLKSTFWVTNGTVDENVVEFWTVREDGGMILAYTDAKYCKACNDFSSGNSLSIDIGSQAVRKRGAFGFNANCLISVKGCTTAADLLPAIHHD
jgi:hypothetical protein